MANKPLFSVDLTHDKNNCYYDDTPFTTARLTPATREACEASSHELHKIIMKSLHLPSMIAGGITLFLGIVLLGGALKAAAEVGFAQALKNGFWLIPVGAVLTVAGAVLLLIHKKITNRQTESDETSPEEELSNRNAENVAQLVQMELGTPEDDEVTDLEILHYRYKTTENGNTKEQLKNGCYDNSSLFFWREGDLLCMTDYDCVQKIPMSAIEGYYTVDEKYRIDCWLKDEEFDQGEYAQYGIKQDSEGNYKLHTYYRVIIRDGEDTYEFRIPCYDFPVFQKLVDIQCLDGIAEV